MLSSQYSLRTFFFKYMTLTNQVGGGGYIEKPFEKQEIKRSCFLSLILNMNMWSIGWLLHLTNTRICWLCFPWAIQSLFENESNNKSLDQPFRNKENILTTTGGLKMFVIKIKVYKRNYRMRLNIADYSLLNLAMGSVFLNRKYALESNIFT